MPKLLTQGVSLEPKNGRQLIGIVAGFKSEWWPVIDRNAGRLQLGIRKFSGTFIPAGAISGQANTPMSRPDRFSYLPLHLPQEDAPYKTLWTILRPIDLPTDVRRRCPIDEVSC